MLIGYMRISKSDDSQLFDLQYDALINTGVNPDRIYKDSLTGRHDNRPGLKDCMIALREGDALVVWKLDRLARNLRDLIKLVDDLSERKIGFKVLESKGANIDTLTPNGRLIFSIFGALAEFETALIRERTMAGLRAARARGRLGGRPRKMTVEKLRMAMKYMSDRNSRPQEVIKSLAITKGTLYRYVNGDGSLKDSGRKLLEENGNKS